MLKYKKYFNQLQQHHHQSLAKYYNKENEIVLDQKRLVNYFKNQKNSEIKSMNILKLNLRIWEGNL